MNHDPAVPLLCLLFRAEIKLANAQELGETPQGRRRIIPITGGTFEGPRMCGEVMPGGADWQLVHPDGAAILDARYTLRTHDGGLIYVNNRGLRHGPPDVLARIARGDEVDPAQYYFRTTPVFETGAANYLWLNTLIAIASGMRRRDAVVLDVYKVL